MSSWNLLKKSTDAEGDGPSRKPSRSGWSRPAIVIALALFFALIVIGASSHTAQAIAAPDVNGLFYADGDHELYWFYGESEYGSDLYVHLDGTTLYVALVVAQNVNDNACAPDQNPGPSAYLDSADWDKNRNCRKGTDSEYVQFGLECPLEGQSWAWQQGYADQVNGQWLSDTTIGSGAGTPPPGYNSSSSWVQNMIAYEDYRNGLVGDPVWDLYLGGDETTAMGG
ncbi:MAG: hypothetical protein R3300_20630, partial [Candidatus Promineifilaceae bacterium]|nr:hypothetical protein [Candidatus Promineifilaceae bacterium]